MYAADIVSIWKHTGKLVLCKPVECSCVANVYNLVTIGQYNRRNVWTRLDMQQILHPLSSIEYSMHACRMNPCPIKNFLQLLVDVGNV